MVAETKDVVVGEEIEVSDRRKHPFYVIDNDLIAVYGPVLGVYGIAVYNVLAYYANRQDEAWPSYQTMADDLGVSRPKVIETIKQLVELGLVKKVVRQRRGGKRASNRYALVNPHHTDRAAPMNGKPHLPSLNENGKSHLPPPNENSKPYLPVNEVNHRTVNDIDHTGKQDLPPMVNDIDLNGKQDLPEQEPMNNTQLEQDPKNKRDVGADAPTPPSSPDWEKWVGALCWACHGHMEPGTLTEKARGALLAEAKRIRVAGRADCGMLKRWFLEVWKNDWRWQKGEQRPDPAQVRSGLAAYAQARAESAELTETAMQHQNGHTKRTQPKPVSLPVSTADPWPMVVAELASQFPNGVLERAQAEKVGEHNEAETWQIILDPADAEHCQWLNLRGAVLIRKTLASILQRAVLVDVVLPKEEAA